MAKNDNLKDFLTDVADAIREKKGTSEPINPQEFSNEIKGIESGSPFAVDFGEEIARNNSETLSILQEEIAYYNEIQRKRKSGEVTDAELLNDAEFKSAIAWWPSGMNMPNSGLGAYTSLKVISGFEAAAGVRSNLFARCASLEVLKNLDVSKATNLSSMISYTAIKELDVYCDAAINLSSFAAYALQLRKLKVYAPLNTTYNGAFTYCRDLIDLDIDISKVTNIANAFSNCSSLRNAKISGMAISLSITSSPNLTPESIHYIIDEAIGSDSTITLSLHATAKANWEKSKYYESDVATAISKNITIA